MEGTTHAPHAHPRPCSFIELNQEKSKEFNSPEARRAREAYRAAHPTEITALKCMDGRLNLSVCTETPVGIIQPFRNIGGLFDLGWPYLGEILPGKWVKDVRARWHPGLVLAAYHFSKGDPKRGCAGFKYDTEAARAAAKKVVDQFSYVYEGHLSEVHPVLIGMETDEDALIFHGADGDDVFNVADHIDLEKDELDRRFMELYPQMYPQARRDLLALVEGNQQWVKKIRAAQREPIDLNHREHIICVGRGFDWLHEPNKALIIGPYGVNWPVAVGTAGSIVMGNIEAGRLNAEPDLTLVAASLCSDEKGSPEWRRHELKARSMCAEALAALRAEVPQLLEKQKLTVITGVVDAETRLMHVLD